MQSHIKYFGELLAQFVKKGVLLVEEHPPPRVLSW